MSDLTHLGGGVFRWVLQTSWQAAVLAALILLAQWLLRKRLPPSWRYGLWLLLVLRLLMPASPQSAFSIFNLARTAPVHPVVMNPPPPPAPAVGAIEPVATFPSNVPAFAEPREARPFIQTPSAARSAAKVDWFGVVLCGWLAGVCFFGARLVWSNGRFRSRIGRYQPVADESVTRLFDDCRAVFKITLPVSLIESEEVESPAVYGFWRKWLLLPDGVFDHFSSEELRCIFLHELAHIKRGDVGVNWLVAGLQVVHWFNPVLWLAWRRMRADRELATDALALAHIRENDHAPYGETILKVLEGLTGERVLPGLVGIAETKANLKERLAAIVRPGRYWKWAAVAAAALVAGLGLTGAQIKTPSPGKTEGSPSSIRRVVTNGPVMKLIVLDSESGKPVPDAEVLAPHQAGYLSGEEDAPRWTADKNGVASIRLGEPPQDHLRQMTWFTMSVVHDGYAPRGLSWSAENKDVRPSLPGEVTVRLVRGLTVGGVVRDEEGAPIAGVQVQIWGSSYWAGLRHEYSEFWTGSPISHPVMTDAEGRWQVKDFPHDLEYICMTLSWQDGPGEQFTVSPGTIGLDPFKYQNPGQPFSLADLRTGKVALTLKQGVTVRGLVMDPAGQPLAGVPVKTGFGIGNVTRLKETRTDAAGRFEFRHFLHRQLIVTAYPRDFAVTSAIIDVTTNATESRIQAAPLQPLRIRVEDGKGRPVAGAAISVDAYRSEGQLLDFAAKTGQDGITVWSNTPVSAFAIRASSPDGGLAQKIRLAPGERDITFKLRAGMGRELVITAAAHNAETGDPVQLDSLRFQTADREGINGEGDKVGAARQLKVAVARFRPGVSPAFQLEAQAKGFATFISPWRDFEEGDWSPDFALEPAHHSSKTVLLPNGSPAAGARVWSHFGPGQSTLIINQGQYYGNRLTQTRASDDGSFELPGEPDDAAIIITHADGFLNTTMAEIKGHPTVQLRPYGRVEGVLKIAGRPREDVSVHIASLSWGSQRNFNQLYSTTTAADGSFVFPGLPAGDYTVYRQLIYPQRAQRMGPINGEHQMPVTVKAGETLALQYSNSGRQVVGQALPDNPNLEVDWLYDEHALTLKQPTLPSVNLNDYADRKDFEAARAKENESPALRRQLRQARTCMLEFEPDGSFHADDVPPGVYELRIHLTKPKPGNQPGWSPFPNPDDDLGVAIREVVVPPGDGPFNLGKLTVKIKDAGGQEKRAVADFTGRALDGHSVSLAQYRGKFLVLAFWASWSDRCTEQLETVRKLEEELSRDDRVAFLGVSVAEEPQTIRPVVEARGYKWTQMELDAANRTKAAGSFDVNSLPAIYLLDPHGRIVGSSLEADRLRATVERELKN